MSNAFLEELINGAEEECKITHLRLKSDGTGVIWSNKICYALYVDSEFDNQTLNITLTNKRKKKVAKIQRKVIEVKEAKNPNEIFLDSEIITSLRIIESYEIIQVKINILN